MSKLIDSTPRADGFRMPGEFEPHRQIWMLWPQRPDNWRLGGKPAQRAWVDVASAISRFEPVTVGVNHDQYENAVNMLPGSVRVVEISNNDSWMRDCGPSFVVNDKGDVRLVDWGFNAWGGLYDGLYFPWDKDDLVAQKVAQIEQVDRYKAPLIMEGGSFHVDGEGTVLTTEECLLSPGRNPDLTREQIEEHLRDYLNVEKVIWLGKGIDPDETNGHVDDVACFVRPGVVMAAVTDDKDDWRYELLQDNLRRLRETTDAKGRKLEVITLPMPAILEIKEYIDTLPEMICRDTGRVHPSFSQTTAITGRLSCSDPNLQNIPVRTEMGRRIRQGFIAGSREMKLISADYSQVELRILAHLSGDPALHEAFARGADIHSDTAARIFGVPVPLLQQLDKATLNNMETMGIQFVNLCLRPWAVQVEQEFARKLLTYDERRSESYFFRFNFNGLLRADTKARGEYYKLALGGPSTGIGFLSVNEVRELENFDRVEDGDDVFTADMLLEMQNTQTNGQETIPANADGEETQNDTTNANDNGTPQAAGE